MKKLFFVILAVYAVFTVLPGYADNLENEDLVKKIAAIEAQLARLNRQLERESSKDSSADKVQRTKNWQINSYGNMLYKSHQVFKNTQDITPKRRSITDLERVVIEFEYQFTPQWQMELELEYEHGGTGAALEYDGFEEFGEFESEIEAGGEVLVEKLEFEYALNDNMEIKFGRIFVPVGLGTQLHKPDQYLTTERYWSESSLIPQVWHETGVNFVGKWQDFSLQALITSGLNSEYFRTYNWVANGHQKRFEQVNTDDLAFTLRLEYGDMKLGSGVGVSLYNSDTSENRNKINRLDGNGKVNIVSVQGVWRQQNWLAKGQYIFGKLSDSSAITQANKTTPGLQPGNFAQLGSEAESAMVEVAYNAQQWFNLPHTLQIFTNFQYANPMKHVAQGNATERFNRQEISVGLNYYPTKNLVLKAQLAEQDFKQANLNNTTSLSLAVGYQFSI